MTETVSENKLTSEQYDDLCKRYTYLEKTNALEWDDVRPALEYLGVPLAGHEFREMTGGKTESKMSMEQFKDLYSKAKDIKDTTKMIKKALLLKKVEDIEEFTDPIDTDVRHSVSKAEERGFTTWINKNLGQDKDLNPGILPIDPNVDGQLYDRCVSGILLCKLINVSSPNTIDERSINKGPTLKTVFNIHENLTLAVNSAAAIGCCVVNMGPEDIEKKKRHIVLGLIWQLIRRGLVDTITLNRHKELLTLLKEGEEPDDLMRLKPEELLIRWVNHQLAKAGCPRQLKNLTTDLRDCEIYTYLIDQICPDDKRDRLHPIAQIMSTKDPKERARLLLENAELLTDQNFLSPDDIYNADDSRERLHLAFLATLFNQYPCMDSQTDYQIESETLEEKTYRNWMNSLGVKPFVHFIDADLANGLVLLQLIDILQPGTVNWSVVYMKFDPKKQLFQEQANCNMVITCARDINVRFVNVSGEDIRERQKKLILGVVFQLMHHYTYKLLHQACGEGGLMPRDEKDSLIWANERLTEAKAKTVNGFRDPAFATGRPILQILEQIKPGSTDKSVWTGEGDDFSRCTYAISCSRKAGAPVYTLPEHLRDLNGKMIQTTLICLQALDYKLRREEALQN
ncbi:unnamed protein product [Calicophoron daubneyi]|uniref:Calponin-homology (CH) domain-containing protein n=1 Tax=Calicophoron daubneyi TaxID=300641 RepID=A0AAV2TME1_CALDB